MNEFFTPIRLGDPNIEKVCEECSVTRISTITPVDSGLNEQPTTSSDVQINCPPNDIGLAAGKVLQTEEKIKFLEIN